MTVFSAQRVYEAMKQVVQEAGPDFVYDKNACGRDGSCRYYWRDQPDCLIGKVLAKLGIDVKTELEGVGQRPYDWRRTSRQYLAERFTDNALAIMQTAQLLQDKGTSWGNCIEIENLTSHMIQKNVDQIID